MLKVFIAGPYSAPSHWQREMHVHAACEAAKVLIDEGFLPYVPHLSHYIDCCYDDLEKPSYEVWMAQTLAWVSACDILLIIAASPGANREAERAESLGIPVARSIDEVLILRENLCASQTRLVSSAISDAAMAEHSRAFARL